MTTLALRQKIAEYIHFADEKKVKAIYNLLEENINQKNTVWTKNFTLEMKKRNEDLVSGKIKGKTKTEILNKAKLAIKKINENR